MINSNGSHIKMDLILASASPRREKMLKDAGFCPVVIPPLSEENIPMELKPEEAAMFLALKKSLSVQDTELYSRTLKSLTSRPLIVSADTIVVKNGEIIGKPADEKEALRALMKLSGCHHLVITGVAVAGTVSGLPVCRLFYEKSKVFFKKYGHKDIEEYLSTKEPYDKAGGYSIQGHFRKYVDHYEGDHDNIVGLPLTSLKKVFKTFQ
ncbi:MAG TPA: Maf family protein [Bacillota bacterium]|nr:Maf family protein [Bacillota bacterium]